MSRLELHPTHRNARYTIRGLFGTEAEAQEKADELVEAGFDVYAFRDNAPKGMVVYGVAARHSVEATSRTGIPHEYSSDWIITRAAVDLFRRIMRTAGGSRSSRWYKPLDVDLLNRKIRGFSWGGTHLDVAARIISDLVLAHPLPNANHRTSIHLARSYLEACGIQWPHYSLRGKGARRLHRETKEFFVQSKYLLQLYRHPALLKKAHAAGYTHLRIGPEAEAPIREADLALRRPDLAARHLGAAKLLLRDLSREPQLAQLLAPRTKGLREWAQTIRN